jgi:hypothetical protein
MDAIATQMEKERLLRRKRERERDAEDDPFSALMNEAEDETKGEEAEAPTGDEEDGSSTVKAQEEWVSIKQKKEIRSAQVDFLKKKLRGEPSAAEEAEAEASAVAAVEEAAGGGGGGGGTAGEGEEEEGNTLLDEANRLRALEATMDVAEIRNQREAAEEERLRKDADRVQTNALMSAAEVAAGTKYACSIDTGWRPPKHIRGMSDEQAAILRKKVKRRRGGKRFEFIIFCILCNLKNVPGIFLLLLPISLVFLFISSDLSSLSFCSHTHANQQKVVHHRRGRGHSSPHQVLQRHALPRPSAQRTRRKRHQEANPNSGRSRCILQRLLYIWEVVSKSCFSLAPQNPTH